MKQDTTTAIIDSYERLPLGYYLDIVALYADESMEELDRQVKIVSMLTGLGEDAVLLLPIPQFKEYTAALDFLNHEIDTTGAALAETYGIGEFTVQPVRNANELITAQYIDFQSYHKAGLDTHLPELLSCLLVPKGMKYNQGYDVVALQQAIRRELSTYDAFVIYAFFLLSCKESIKDMLIFSLQEARQMKSTETEQEVMELIALLERNGAGLQA